MLKWKLMLTTLPFVLAVTGVKAALEFGVMFPGVVEFSEIGVVLTGAVFLTGFLLAGTMADYKESEKLPGELANNLEALEAMFEFNQLLSPQLDVKHLRKEVLTLTDAIKGWLVKRLTTPEVFAALEAINGALSFMNDHGAGKGAGYALGPISKVRALVNRIDVIRRTGFLPPAYALLEVLLGLMVVLLLVAKFKSQVAEFVIVPTVTLLNVYMLRLIRDIDDPFDYAADGTKRGGAEVDLFPLDEYRERLARRVG